jgi:GNAT superfamily N-acetyltransferase
MAAMEAAQDNGLVWVTVDTDDTPIAFALCWLRPDTLHLREVDVHPDYSRRGLGRQLIEFLIEEARSRGLEQITLTTFSEVPWNAPLYKKYGFVELAEADWPEWMRQIRADEKQIGLDRWPRIAMIRPVSDEKD